MLYWLLYQKLFVYIHAFRVFRYLTIRTAFATLTALLIGLLIGPYLIEKLREFQIGQYIREDGPKDHQKKAGTPTMGGLLICVAILVPTLLWSDLSNPLVWLAILALVGFGGIGFADDYLKVVHKRNLGLTARVKFTAQIGVASLIAIFLLLLRKEGRILHPPDGPLCQALPSGSGSPLHSPRSASWPAGISHLRFVHRDCAGRLQQCRQPDGWSGWSRHWLRHHRGRRTGRT